MPPTIRRIVPKGLAAPPQAALAPPGEVARAKIATPKLTQDQAEALLAVSAATLIYGDTGGGKTSLLETFAKWIWRRFRVRTRYYAFDPGGFSDGMLALVKLGIVEVWRPYTRDPEGHKGLPSETLVRASQGWWPAEIDPATGASPIGCKMIPNPPEWKGAVMFDGLTGMCDWSMIDMGTRSAAGTLGGEAANMKTVESGELKLGLGNRASVGFTQGKVRDWVVSSLSIKGLVHAPVFTALELKTTDQETKLPTYGPKIAGQAKTTDVPTWFGNCLGAVLAKDDKGKEQWRLYLTTYQFPENDRTPHPCKVRTAAKYRNQLPLFLADDPEQGPLTSFNLGGFFEMLEGIKLQALKDAEEEFPDAPGMTVSTVGNPTPGPERVIGVAGGPKRMIRASVYAPSVEITDISIPITEETGAAILAAVELNTMVVKDVTPEVAEAIMGPKKEAPAPSTPVEAPLSAPVQPTVVAPAPPSSVPPASVVEKVIVKPAASPGRPGPAVGPRPATSRAVPLAPIAAKAAGSPMGAPAGTPAASTGGAKP